MHALKSRDSFVLRTRTPFYQMYLTVSNHAMFRQRAGVVLKFLAVKKQLLLFHRDVGSLADSGTDHLDRVHDELDIEGAHSYSARPCDEYPHRVICGLRDQGATKLC